MAEDHMRYDILTREALRGVVRKVLSEVAKTGLPGEHHFFISFSTKAAGVRIAPRLVERYPSEMTIVLQNQFWDLKVNDTGFEVGLSFDDKAEVLIIPFSAILGFFDPSVEFGLKFEVEELPQPEEQKTVAKIKKSVEAETDSPSDTPPDGPEKGDKVISLDAFRKKP
jgi:uncharacterized protein